jgi:hypothetical protein
MRRCLQQQREKHGIGATFDREKKAVVLGTDLETFSGGLVLLCVGDGGRGSEGMYERCGFV